MDCLILTKTATTVSEVFGHARRVYQSSVYVECQRDLHIVRLSDANHHFQFVLKALPERLLLAAARRLGRLDYNYDSSKLRKNSL
jgi:hypothetical protein